MKRKITIDATPSTHIIDSLMHTRMRYPEALAELVDNSLDQEATAIEIRLDSNSVRVADNGQGCSDIACMLKLGQHNRTKSTKLGRFGVGLKNAAAGLGEILEVRTVHNGIEQCGKIDWPGVRDSGLWQFSGATEDDTCEDRNGTAITISQLKSAKCQPKSIVKALGFTFAPALWSGAEIDLYYCDTQIPIEPWQLPPMDCQVDDGDDYADGAIGFTVKAGIVENNQRDPFILSFEHRIIAGTSEPCMDLSASNRFLAFVELKGKWPMLKHKDGLRDSPEAEWLYESLFQICQPLLARVHTEGEAIELQELESELDLALQLSRKGRAKRPGSTDQKDAVAPQDTDRSVLEAETVAEAGDVRERGNRANTRGCNLRYQPLDGGVIGKVRLNKKRVEIFLNELHPCVADCRKRRDKPFLKAISMALLSSHQATTQDPSQLVFNFEAESSGDRFVAMFSQMMDVLARTDFTSNEEAA